MKNIEKVVWLILIFIFGYYINETVCNLAGCVNYVTFLKFSWIVLGFIMLGVLFIKKIKKKLINESNFLIILYSSLFIINAFYTIFFFKKKD